MFVEKIEHLTETPRLGIISHVRAPKNALTLCGLDLSGKSGAWSPSEKVWGKIDCPDCVSIIEYCHRIDQKNLAH